MRAALFNHIKTRLETIGQIRWVDLDTRQVDEPKENYPVPFPAVLVLFNDFFYQQGTHGGQEVSAKVSLNVWQYRYTDHFNPRGQKEISDLFGLVESIGNTMHNSYIDTVSISPFKRTAESTIAQVGNLFGYSIQFEAILHYCPPVTYGRVRKLNIEKVKHQQG